MQNIEKIQKKYKKIPKMDQKMNFFPKGTTWCFAVDKLARKKSPKKCPKIQQKSRKFAKK
jgi:hypothetical protein